jgi:GT2 family glycosyltransferase
MGLNLRGALIELRCRGGLIRCAKQLPAILRCFGWKRGFKFLYKQIRRNDYQTWIQRYDTSDAVLEAQIRDQIKAIETPPKISLLMPVQSIPLKFLQAAIASVQSQSYDNWELCLLTDASVDPAAQAMLQALIKADSRIHLVSQPMGATSAMGESPAGLNAALTQITGTYLATITSCDVLSRHALFYVEQAIAADRDVALLYTDEDRISEQGVRYAPHFKCAFNLELMLAQNRIGHLVVYRSERVKEAGGWRPGFAGAEDYDLALRLIARLQPSQIIHIPRVLYHQRTVRGMLVANTVAATQAVAAGRRAVGDYLASSGRGGSVEPCPEAPQYNRVRYPRPKKQPLVSIIIPTRDRAELLGMCLDSIFAKTTDARFEIIIVDNGSVEAATQALFQKQPAAKVKVLRDDAPFNYSRLNNLGVRAAQGDVICLMNNDIEILTPDWIEEMLSFALQPDIGCVGARLWFPDGRLQHAGVITGLGDIAGHPHKFFPKAYPGYHGRAVLTQSFSAVTAACLMVRRQVWEQVNGLDETLAVAFNDVDFCLRVKTAGYQNVWTPYAEMNHHESASRGNETTPEKQARYQAEIERMISRWGDVLDHDPAYNPNLTLKHDDFSLAWPASH